MDIQLEEVMAKKQNGLDKQGLRMLIREYMSRVIIGLLLFISSGDWNWVNAWLYIGFALLTILMVHWFVVSKNPELYNERGAVSANAKEWDKNWIRFYALMGYLTLVFLGLDHRYGWSHLSPLYLIPGALLVITSGTLSSWAMAVNHFFSSVIRIQDDRGHKVVDSGPYRFIRHPGYLGGIFFYFGTPMILDSWIGFFPILLITAGFILRIRFEEKTLIEELEGYADYKQKVKFRLIPGIW